MKPVQDPTKYYSSYSYNPIGTPREEHTYDDYVTFYKNHWSGRQDMDQIVKQGEVNNIYTKNQQKLNTITADPMWYDWYAINSNSLTALQGLGVFLLLNIIGAKIGLLLVCRGLK